MERDQQVIQEIGKALWSVLPTEAHSTSFSGMFFEGMHESQLDWFDLEGNRVGPTGLGSTPRGPMRTIETLCLELQRTPPFDRQPFTHMRYELSSEGKVNVDFAYIPEWDSWPGLFMQGVSDLTEEEARNPAISNTWGVDLQHWLKCRELREKEPYQK